MSCSLVAVLRKRKVLRIVLAFFPPCRNHVEERGNSLNVSASPLAEITRWRIVKEINSLYSFFPGRGSQTDQEIVVVSRS